MQRFPFVLVAQWVIMLCHARILKQQKSRSENVDCGVRSVNVRVQHAALGSEQVSVGAGWRVEKHQIPRQSGREEEELKCCRQHYAQVMWLTEFSKSCSTRPSFS